MGKTQSKLSPEDLAQLQRNTYCECTPSLCLTFRPRTTRREGARLASCVIRGTQTDAHSGARWEDRALTEAHVWIIVDKKELQQWCACAARARSEREV